MRRCFGRVSRAAAGVFVSAAFGGSVATSQTADAPTVGAKQAADEDWSAPFDVRPANAQISNFVDVIDDAIENAKKAGQTAQADAWQRRLDVLNKSRDAAEARFEESDRAELHVIGLYKGDYILEKGGKRADGTRVRGVAHVHVSHTAAPVVLALCSYEPVMWDVRVDKGVRLKKVIVSGYYGSDAAAPKDVPVVGARAPDDKGHGWYFYEKRNAEFYRAAADLQGRTRLSIRSFQGKNSPETTEFVVGPTSEAWRDEYLAASYEALARDATVKERAAMVAKLDALRFEAPVFAGGDGRHGDGARSFGTFSGRGPYDDSVQPLPERAGRVVRDVVSGDWYAIANHELARLLPAERRGAEPGVEKIPFGPGFPGISHPCGLAFDTRRRRVIVATLGGVGHLCAYDLGGKSWSLLGELGNRDLCGLAYDAKNDAILGLHAEYDAGGVNKVVKLNAKGGVIGELELTPPIVTGSDHGFGVDVFATVVDDWLLAITSNEVNRAAGNLGTISVVDAATGRGLLSKTLSLQKGGIPPASRDATALKAERQRMRAEIERLTRDAKAIEERLEALSRENKQE